MQPACPTHISGGIKGTEEKRTLDWNWRDHEDGIFGKLKGRSRFVKLSDLSAGEGTVESDLDFLTKGWEGGMSEYVYLAPFGRAPMPILADRFRGEQCTCTVVRRVLQQRLDCESNLGVRTGRRQEEVC